MGTPLFAFNALFTPLQQFVRFVARRLAAPPQAVRPLPAKTCVATPSAAATPASASPRRLRVVRVLESSHAAACAGRMVISGRMADVCAELERLAALEAAAG